MYQIIFSDIDGTLRNSKREITEKTKECIKKLKEIGIEIILCSGRPRAEVEKVSKECDASRYIISSNGAEVYDYISKKVIYSNPMKMTNCKELCDIAIQNNCIISMHQGNNRITNKEKYNDTTEIVLNSKELKDVISKESIVQCVILDKEIQKIRNVREKILQLDGIRIINESKCLTNPNEKNTGTLYCDIVDKSTSKGQALKNLCEILGVNSKDTIGIGDSFNDIEMLDFVGYSVAMGNAIDSLKRHVNEVTCTNDEDGAAVFFEKIINNRKN